MLKMVETTLGEALKKGQFGKYAEPEKENTKPDSSNESESLGSQIYNLFYQKYSQVCCLWIPGKDAINFNDGIVTVNFLNNFSLEHFNEKYGNEMKKCCQEILGKTDFDVSYKIDPSLMQVRNQVPQRVDDYPEDQNKKSRITFPYKTKGLDNLVLFQGNTSAVEEARSIVGLLKDKKEPENVIYLEGPNGSGKTQIISAMGKDAFGNKILMRYLRIRHILDYFMLHKGSSPPLDEYLKNVRILAIDSFDDIFNPKGEALKGVQSLIHEFFDYALEKNMQVVLASTRESREIVEKLDEAGNPSLRDRVAGVKRIGIELPFEDRVDFLKKFIPSLVDNYPKNPEDLEKLAQSYHNSIPKPVSIRDMAGTFLTASRIAQRQRTEITPGIVKRVSYYQPNLFESEKSKPLEVVSATVNLVSDIDVKEVLGKSRKHPVVEARNYAAFALSEICGLNLSEIGRVLGKTHATIIHSLETAREKLDSEENIRLFLDRVKKKLVK